MDEVSLTFLHTVQAASLSITDKSKMRLNWLMNIDATEYRNKFNLKQVWFGNRSYQLKVVV